MAGVPDKVKQLVETFHAISIFIKQALIMKLSSEGNTPILFLLHSAGTLKIKAVIPKLIKM